MATEDPRIKEIIRLIKEVRDEQKTQLYFAYTSEADGRETIKNMSGGTDLFLLRVSESIVNQLKKEMTQNIIKSKDVN